MERLDQELSAQVSMGDDARARMLSRMRSELPKAPGANRWRFEIAAVVASALLMTAAIAGVLLWSGSTGMQIIAARAGALAMCGLVCAFAATVALAPGFKRGQLISLIAFAAAAVALVLVRKPVGDSSLPEWICTATHVGFGAVPLIIGLVALRRGGMRLLAGLALGVSAGTTGAMVGELGCGRDSTHVLLFHVTAWAVMILAGALLSRFVKPRSHAP